MWVLIFCYHESMHNNPQIQRTISLVIASASAAIHCFKAYSFAVLFSRLLRHFVPRHDKIPTLLLASEKVVTFERALPSAVSKRIVLWSISHWIAASLRFSLVTEFLLCSLLVIKPSFSSICAEFRRFNVLHL